MKKGGQLWMEINSSEHLESLHVAKSPSSVPKRFDLCKGFDLLQAAIDVGLSAGA